MSARTARSTRSAFPSSLSSSRPSTTRSAHSLALSRLYRRQTRPRFALLPGAQVCAFVKLSLKRARLGASSSLGRLARSACIRLLVPPAFYRVRRYPAARRARPFRPSRPRPPSLLRLLALDDLLAVLAQLDVLGALERVGDVLGVRACAREEVRGESVHCARERMARR